MYFQIKNENLRKYSVVFFNIFQKEGIYQPFWTVYLFLTDKNFNSVLEKMEQRDFIKFCIKNEIKCANTVEMLTVWLIYYKQNTSSIVV